jgi:hypothetical protein
MIRNLKSKTCTELCRSIENLKWLGDSAQRVGAGGSGHQVTVVSDQRSVVSEKLEKNE